MRHDANNHTREVSQQCSKQRSMETVTRSQDRFSPPFHSPVMSEDKTSERFTPHKTVYVANRTIFLFLLLWLSLLDTVSHETSTLSQQAVHFFLPPFFAKFNQNSLHRILLHHKMQHGYNYCTCTLSNAGASLSPTGPAGFGEQSKISHTRKPAE